MASFIENHFYCLMKVGDQEVESKADFIMIMFCCCGNVFLASSEYYFYYCWHKEQAIKIQYRNSYANIIRFSSQKDTKLKVRTCTSWFSLLFEILWQPQIHNLRYLFVFFLLFLSYFLSSFLLSFIPSFFPPSPPSLPPFLSSSPPSYQRIKLDPRLCFSFKFVSLS